MKKITSLLLVLSMVFTLASCSTDQSSDSGGSSTDSVSESNDTTENAGTPEYTFTIGTSATSSSIIGQTMQYFADLVEEKSGGAIVVQCYTDSQLGSDSELLEGVQMGTISMVIGSTAPQATFIPALALFDLPQVYDSIEDAYTVIPEFKDTLSSSFDGTNLHLGSLFATVYRWMSSSKEINSFDDFKGIQIRTMENSYHMAYWNQLGCTATPLAFSELYMGLQQGVVDAQENPLDVFMSSNFYEVQDYVIMTKHIVFTATILMNEDLYSSLPEEYQAIMDECFAAAEEYGQAYAMQAEDENIERAEAEGVIVTELSDEVYAQMKEATSGIEDMIRDSVGDELVDAYLAAIEDAAK